jgi:hypothetical protein
MPVRIRHGIVSIAAVASGTLLGIALLYSSEPDLDWPYAAAYETTGSAGSMAERKTILPLSDEQRERIYRDLLDFPDAPRRDARKPELADKVANDEPIQKLPEDLTREMPVLDGHQFLKLEDRIVLVDPTTRVVVAMIPRYRLLQ